jgi:putative glutamine amidotransferase
MVLVPAQAVMRAGSGGAQPVQALNRAYVAALQAAGLTPVLLPTRSPLPDDLFWASGLLLPGGPDVDPLRYGQDLDPTTDPDLESDQLEFALMDWALQARIPVLAICRGLQVLNVALGGSLAQDLSQHAPRATPEEPLPREQPVHPLTVDRSSRLGQIVGTETIQVNSTHHQGIDQLAAELVATAWAPDGLIEGVEIADDRFLVGVQYHPEELAPNDQTARALFEAFAEACRGWDSARLGEETEAELVTSA